MLELCTAFFTRGLVRLLRKLLGRAERSVRGVCLKCECVCPLRGGHEQRKRDQQSGQLKSAIRDHRTPPAGAEVAECRTTRMISLASLLLSAWSLSCAASLSCSIAARALSISA